ncbi:MAG: hypothetical protein U5Q03_00210 [Bacteroidota bacterium]|nr:hypothetical protein [Bacteroidota bacterium]
MKKAASIFILIIMTWGCNESSKEIFPLYKLSLEVYPAENTFSTHLSLNYASDSMVDTAVFLINRQLKLNKFSGRHLVEWQIDSSSLEKGCNEIKAIFNPALEAHQYVRITAEYNGKLNELLMTENQVPSSFELQEQACWYPRILPPKDFFYAINIKTDQNYRVGPNAHLIEGNWQIISENATNKIQLSFNKSN